jgi:hypothetical protein
VQKSLLEYANIYPQTTPALDAFDECDREKRQTLLQIFDDLIQSSLKSVKILYLVNQIDRAVRDRFQGGANVQISARDNDADIAKFVRTTIDGHYLWGNDHMDRVLHDDIVETLCRKSNAM